MSSLPSPTVLGAFERGADRFRNSLSSEDLHLFSAVTTIEDVWDHVKYMQMEQGSRMALRNMGRIEPFIQGIEQYTKAIDTLFRRNLKYWPLSGYIKPTYPYYNELG
jgi:hypothetical protein